MSKYGSINKTEYGVKYPKREKAYVFIPHNGIPFESAAVGITHPSADYEINRSDNTRVCLFEYVLSGEGEVFLEGRWHTVSAGDFYILPSGMEQHYRSSHTAPMEKIWVNYVSEYMPSFLKSYGITGGIFRSDGAKRLFDELTEITREENLTDETAFRIADRLHRIVRLAATRNTVSGEDERGLRRALFSYVYKKFSLDEMAERLSMSKSNVIRLYKKAYGTTPNNDLINLKIEAAKRLLEETTLPVKEIADKLCIYDEHYFSSLFLSRTSMRPGEFRKKNQ